MAAFGDPYPGVYQPTWWTTTATTTNAWVYPVINNRAGGGQVAPPAPQKAKPRTNLDWLRGRVEEICDLAELVPA